MSKKILKAFSIIIVLTISLTISTTAFAIDQNSEIIPFTESRIEMPFNPVFPINTNLYPSIVIPKNIRFQSIKKAPSGFSSQSISSLIEEKFLITKLKQTEPTYIIEECNKTVVTTSDLVIYEKPNKTSEKLRKIPEKTIINISAQCNDFGQIEYGTETGWIKLKDTTEAYSLTVPMIKQTTNYTCGSACGAMILESLDKPVDEIAFWNRANRNGRGTFVYVITNNLNHYIGSEKYSYIDLSGENTEIYYEKIKKSIENGYPVMLPLRFLDIETFSYDSEGHYVLIKTVYEMDNNYFCIVNDSWTGNILTISLDKIVEYSKAHSGFIICND